MKGILTKTSRTTSQVYEGMELVYQFSSLEGPPTFMFFTSKKLGTLWHDICESVYFFVLKMFLKKIVFFFKLIFLVSLYGFHMLMSK